MLKMVNDTILARSYARSCYQQDSGPADCSVYPRAQLPYSSTLTTCPFGFDPSGEISCIPGAKGALQLDTDLLDSNDYFGINAAKHNRVLFRKRLTCSPIRIHDYVVSLNDTDLGYPILQYNMGYVSGGNDNWTFAYDAHASLDPVGYQVS